MIQPAPDLVYTCHRTVFCCNSSFHSILKPYGIVLQKFLENEEFILCYISVNKHFGLRFCFG